MIDKTNCIQMLMATSCYHLESVKHQAILITIEHFKELKESAQWKEVKLNDSELV